MKSIKWFKYLKDIKKEIIKSKKNINKSFKVLII